MKKLTKKPLKSLRNITGVALFAREFVTHPAAMGAAWPSSKHLGLGIAAEVPMDSNFVIELGAGTGVVTEALLERGIAPEKLCAVERSASLSKHLRKRFPKLNVIEGDARELDFFIDTKQQPVSTIVSGLPLRSLPSKVIKDVGVQLDKVLDKKGTFIQFTYSLHRRPIAPSKQLRWKYSKYIWRNFPPARVDVFTYAGE